MRDVRVDFRAARAEQDIALQPVQDRRGVLFGALDHLHLLREIIQLGAQGLVGFRQLTLLAQQRRFLGLQRRFLAQQLRFVALQQGDLRLGLLGLARPMHSIAKPGTESGTDHRANRAGRKGSDHPTRYESGRLLRGPGFRVAGERRGADAHQPYRPHPLGILGISRAHDPLLAPRPKEAATAAPWRPLQAGIRAFRGWSRGKSWRGAAELQQGSNCRGDASEIRPSARRA